MHFPTPLTTILITLTALTTAIPTLSKRQQTPQQALSSLDSLTTQLQQLQTTANAIDPLSTAVPVGKFTPLVSDLRQLINSLQTTITEQQYTRPFNDADAKKVCVAFTKFATTGTSTFDLIKTKAGGVFEALFTAPVVSSLRLLEAQLDTLAYGIIEVVPVCVGDVRKAEEPLEISVKEAKCAYVGTGPLGLQDSSCSPEGVMF